MNIEFVERIDEYDVPDYEYETRVGDYGYAKRLRVPTPTTENIQFLIDRHNQLVDQINQLVEYIAIMEEGIKESL